jgi:hypothetical protein
MPSALDLCPLLLAINSRLQFARGEGGKKKKRKEFIAGYNSPKKKKRKREERFGLLFKVFFSFYSRV